MSIDEKARYLERYLQCERSLKERKEELEALKSLTMRVTSCISSAPKRNSGKEKDDSYSAYIDMKSELQKELVRLKNIKAKIIKSINSLNDERFLTIMRYRYIMGYTWERIAEEYDVTTQCIYKYRKKALTQIKICA